MLKNKLIKFITSLLLFFCMVAYYFNPSMRILSIALINKTALPITFLGYTFLNISVNAPSLTPTAPGDGKCSFIK